MLSAGFDDAKTNGKDTVSLMTGDPENPFSTSSMQLKNDFTLDRIVQRICSLGLSIAIWLSAVVIDAQATLSLLLLFSPTIVLALGWGRGSERIVGFFLGLVLSVLILCLWVVHDLNTQGLRGIQ